jgi:hypothetical protein
LFEAFKLNYPFWNHALGDDHVRAKKRMWGESLEAIDDDRVRQAMAQCIQNFGDKSGPTIEQFMRFTKRHEAHQSFPHSQRIGHQSDKQEAKEATYRAFCARFENMPESLTVSTYTGAFPVQEVADAVHLPSGPSLKNHEYSWSKLRESFEAVWRETQ